MSETATVPRLSAHLAWMDEGKSPFEMAPTELLGRATEFRAMAVNTREPEHIALIRIAERYETMAAARSVELGRPPFQTRTENG